MNLCLSFGFTRVSNWRDLMRKPLGLTAPIKSDDTPHQAHSVRFSYLTNARLLGGFHPLTERQSTEGRNAPSYVFVRQPDDCRRCHPATENNQSLDYPAFASSHDPGFRTFGEGSPGKSRFCANAAADIQAGRNAIAGGVSENEIESAKTKALSSDNLISRMEAKETM